MDPNLLAPGAGIDGAFQSGQPYSTPRKPSSALTARYLESQRQEFKNLLAAAGIEPNALDNTQLLQAIQLLSVFGLAEKAAIGAPMASLAAGPYVQSGARLAIPLFDMPGLWICGNSRERPHQGTSTGGGGGVPRSPVLDGAFSVGATTISVKLIRGNVAPAAGMSFRVGPNATVYTVSSVANYDSAARTADITFTPSLAFAGADNDLVAFRVLVDNGAGYSAGATTIHVDSLIDAPPNTGCTFTVIGHATVYTINAHSNWQSPHDGDITFAPALTQNIADNVEVVVTGCTIDNTEEANNYEVGGRFNGERWPYQACDAAIAHNNAGAGSHWGSFPACWDKTSIDCYSKGFLVPRRTFAGCATLELNYFGDWVVGENNLFLEWIVAPNLNAATGFDFGNMHAPFQSDVLNTAVFGTGTFPVHVTIWIQSAGRTQVGSLYPLTHRALFVVGNKNTVNGGTGCNPPAVYSPRGPVLRAVGQATHNWRRADTRMPVLWKYENSTLLGSPGRAGAGVLALHNSTNLLRISHTSARLWMGQH